ncbi:hypothetical protein L873DRAFT_811915 [Choiromyces venosus 120613-1]|uniref:Uncharacterized protein n=1 Tax=Choiromyces venosus 120613-1 TaxID=1336337 RepID=A0A3N4JT13_9PEZI|nr:hypothetical protein L873DRAFT_811915 [Choiromyces venosus 120613-1]
MAGSFGGFLKRTSSPGLCFGITAAHYLPESDLSTPVCSPSSVEATGRLNRLLRYTTLCPTTDRLHINQTKDMEAKSLLQQFRFMDTPSGTLLLDLATEFQPKIGVLTGTRVGHIVASRFGNQQRLLHDYDQRLAALGHDIFRADPSWETRMDWSIFSCDPARYGGNVYDGEAIEQTGVLYPGAEVEKIGRTTGAQNGYVNCFFLQRWHSSVSTHEIAIIGELGRSFAEVRDSGGCVFVKVNHGYQAAGILIGINQKNDFAIVTPLDLILASVPEYEWA